MRVIYSPWWKGKGRGSRGTWQVHWEEGVRSLENRNQRWGQTATSLTSGVKCTFTPLEAPQQRQKDCFSSCVNICAYGVRAWLSYNMCLGWFRAMRTTRVSRSVACVLRCYNHLSCFILLTFAQRTLRTLCWHCLDPCVHCYYTSVSEGLWSLSCNAGDKKKKTSLSCRVLASFMGRSSIWVTFCSGGHNMSSSGGHTVLSTTSCVFYFYFLQLPGFSAWRP